mmetsp:Transcript_15256/g.41524  ORF Transcript_15256/g.41524 Transcript_15256/m.41524 type:complete len:604 (-) Transcript_15256:143-1954(-)
MPRPRSASRYPDTSLHCVCVSFALPPSSRGVAGVPRGTESHGDAKSLQNHTPVPRRQQTAKKKKRRYRLGAMRGAKGEQPSANDDKAAMIQREYELTEALKKKTEELHAAQRQVEELTRATRDLDAVRASFATADAALDRIQLTARNNLRERMESRRTKRVARVEKATSQVAKNSAAGPIEGSSYSFTTGAPVTTEVLVARGVVAAPEQAAFEIVPMASASSPLFVFTDETVNSLYGDRFISGFERMGFVVHRIVIPDGEDAKTLEVYAELADRVLTVGIDKLSILISLGGGAVANVCGFIASTLHRGIGLIHFPTTLLAQCDAAISHKQAVNAPHGKNLVGSYYAPIRIVVDPDVLQTLDDWLLPDGMGEIVKHALCQDATLLKMLDEYDGPLTDPAFLERVVRRTIELKCQVIDIDPKEKREAVVLVYGHTLGHPIEAISHRPGSLCCLSHGQAVAIGCVVAARVAVKMGLCDHAVIQRTVDLCKKYELPTVVPADQSVDRIMAKLPYNKTWTQEGTVMALLEDIGRLFNVDQSYLLPVSESVIREAVTETMAPPGTVIRGAGSSGFLRRNKVSANDILEAADKPIPGSGWDKNSAVPHAC